MNYVHYSLSNFNELISTTLLQGCQRLPCCTVTSLTTTIQLTLPSTMKSSVKEDRREIFYRLPFTKHNVETSGTELDSESI